MTAADFFAQYTIAVFFVICAAHRHLLPMLCDGNVEWIVKEQEREDDAFEAKIWLARMK